MEIRFSPFRHPRPMHRGAEELETSRELAVGSCEVVVVGDETEGLSPLQPLSSLFVTPGFTFQAIVEGEFALRGFEIELRRDSAFNRSGEDRGKMSQMCRRAQSRKIYTFSHERKGISTGGFHLEPPEAFRPSALRPIRAGAAGLSSSQLWRCDRTSRRRR